MQHCNNVNLCLENCALPNSGGTRVLQHFAVVVAPVMLHRVNNASKLSLARSCLKSPCRNSVGMCTTHDKLSKQGPCQNQRFQVHSSQMPTQSLALCNTIAVGLALPVVHQADNLWHLQAKFHGLAGKGPPLMCCCTSHSARVEAIHHVQHTAHTLRVGAHSATMIIMIISTGGAAQQSG